MDVITIDIEELKTQINSLKQKMLAGIHEGLLSIEDMIANRMEYYMQTKVYDVYVPIKYDRTMRLLNSIDSRVNGTELKVFSNPSGLDSLKMFPGVPYSWRVFYGDDVFPYDYPINQTNSYDYEPARDWVTPTIEEIKNHLGQGEYIINKFVQTVQNEISKVGG